MSQIVAQKVKLFQNFTAPIFMTWESWRWNPLTGFLSLKTHFGAQKPFWRWKNSLWNWGPDCREISCCWMSWVWWPNMWGYRLHSAPPYKTSLIQTPLPAPITTHISIQWNRWMKVIWMCNEIYTMSSLIFGCIAKNAAMKVWAKIWIIKSKFLGFKNWLTLSAFP